MTHDRFCILTSHSAIRFQTNSLIDRRFFFCLMIARSLRIDILTVNLVYKFTRYQLQYSILNVWVDVLITLNVRIVTKLEQSQL